MSDVDISSVWSQKIEEANETYEKWEKLFHVPMLEEYEEGFQLADDIEAYVLNLFYATIAVKSPSLRFTKPIFNIKASPRTVTSYGNEASRIGANLEDTINTYVLDGRNNFHQEVLSAIDDAWSRFGIIEVGYSANWIDNPKIKSPKVSSDYTPGVTRRRQRTVRSEPEQIPEDEQIYLVNIPAERFRVAANDSSELWQCDWCGYYDYVRVEDLLAIPGIRNKEELREQASMDNSTFDRISSEEREKLDIAGSLDIVKIWKIWDLRSMQKICFSGDVLFWKKSFDVFPFVDLRFKRRKKIKGFLPLPVTFNWLSPQNEINEVRNSHRDHRRRFKRVYLANKNAFDDMTQEEVQNAFINGMDGVVLFANRDGAITPVPNADLGASANISLQTPKDDFNIISGTSSEQRGQSDRTTATQAAIANERTQIRESNEKAIVAEFLQRVGKLILTFHQRKLVNAYSVEMKTQGGLLDNYESETSVRMVDPLIDLGDSDFDYQLMLQVSTISPIAAEEEKQAMIEFLALLSQYPQFGLSPTLIEELAYKTGYHNQKVIGEFQQLAQLQMIGLLQQLGAPIAGAQQGGGASGGNQQQLLQQMTPPGQEQIRQQLEGQGIL